MRILVGLFSSRENDIPCSVLSISERDLVVSKSVIEKANNQYDNQYDIETSLEGRILYIMDALNELGLDAEQVSQRLDEKVYL